MSNLCYEKAGNPFDSDIGEVLLDLALPSACCVVKVEFVVRFHAGFKLWDSTTCMLSKVKTSVMWELPPV